MGRRPGKVGLSLGWGGGGGLGGGGTLGTPVLLHADSGGVPPVNLHGGMTHTPDIGPVIYGGPGISGPPPSSIGHTPTLSAPQESGRVFIS